MNPKNFFQRTMVSAGALTLCLTLATGLVQPPTAEALNIGKLGGAIAGTAAQQNDVKKSLEYYDDEGRHELFEELKKSEGVYTHPALNGTLDRIMTRLTTAIAKTEPSVTEKPYNYFINPQEHFNAFCSLGHNLSINLGVFQFFNNHEDRVAAVVAHELVHGQRNHPINNAKKKLTVDFLKNVIGSQVGGGTRLAVDIVATNTKAVGITKPNEWEADNIAFDYMTTAGYNPGAPAAVWQHVLDNTGSNSGGNLLTDILNPSTHPDGKARRDNYAKKLHEYSNKKVTVDATSGEIKINNKTFMKPAAFGGMSGIERAYLVAGNLAVLYNSGQPLAEARNDNGVVKIGNQPIIQATSGDTSASELAGILNEIK